MREGGVKYYCVEVHLITDLTFLKGLISVASFSVFDFNSFFSLIFAVYLFGGKT